jgi:hypothetical protein
MLAPALPTLSDLVAPLLGLPYDHFCVGGTDDACWGLVRHLYQVGRQIDLETDPGRAVQHVREVWGLGDSVDPLTLVEPWDFYILATRYPWSDHLGLVVSPLKFVHVRRRTGVCLEALQRWRPKLFQVARLAWPLS